MENKKIKAIILAAGRGTRMGNSTNAKPKCLNKLAGKTFIDWQLDAIRGSGIKDISIVKGYMSDKLDFLGIKEFINKKWENTNMVMSLYCAKPWLESGTNIVSYSDIVYNSDTVKLLTDSKEDIVISYDPNWLNLWSMRFKNPLLDAETFKVDKRSFLVEIGNKAKSTKEIAGQYMGLLKFTPNGWQEIEKTLDKLDQQEKNRLDMTSLLKILISRGSKILAIPIKHRWYEIDNENDLKIYHSLISKNKQRIFDV